MDKTETWLSTFWRPAMAMSYFLICLFDFMFAPIFLGIYGAWTHTAFVIWTPLTLQGGGLYHVAMGAIISAVSWGKSQERIAQTKAALTDPNTIN